MSYHLLAVRKRTSRTFLLALLLTLLIFVAQPIEPVQAANAAEIASLTDFYNDLGGIFWNNNVNWLVGDPCTNNWYGVTCDGSGNVTEVELVLNNLIGNIDDVDMSGLVYLEELHLPYNLIGGNIDGFDLTNNTALEVLYLPYNQIGGSIDGFDLSTNTALVWLHLYGNQIGGNINGFDLSSNTALDRLALYNNQIIGPLPAWMDGVTSPLTYLDLSYNQCLQPSGIPAVDTFVTAQDPDWQTSNIDCALTATAACYGSNLEVTVATGDPGFTIVADDPGGTTQSDTITTGGSTILGSGAGYGTWTNIIVTELSGNTETLFLPNLTCTQAAPAAGGGGGGSCSAQVVSGGPASLTIDVIPPTDPANTERGDGRGIYVLDDTPTWVIEVTNPNSAAVDHVVARAAIPDTAQITNVTTTHGNASADAENVVTMLLGTLEGGETATVTVETKVVPVDESCASVWLDYHQGDDTECADTYMLPGTLPATGGSPRRVADLWAEVLAGGVMLSVALGWVWIKRRRKA